MTYPSLPNTHCQFILIYILLAGMALMFLACTFNFFYVSKAPVCDKERKREQKRLRRSQLLMLKLQNARMFLSVKLSELIALLKALHSGWSLPMDLVIRMLNSKFWVMEADVWADLLYICRWANPDIFIEEVFCALCKGAWKQPIASKCSHLFCCTCITEGIRDDSCCPHEECRMKLSVTVPPRKEYAAETLVRKYEEQCRDKNLKKLISISDTVTDDSHGDHEATTSQDTIIGSAQGI